ncbi:unnamed protein product [Wuchereria bancrofti]|uniref:Uncharacterized protein n=1 Tax=Wuchereria bancrofti TaxID=6293 RepID=A0A3P7EQ78_WUCBA|nr:unnamed protein product [Wuchereria bancrofti]
MNKTNPKQDERVWVPDAAEGFVLGVVIRIAEISCYVAECSR